MSEEKRQAGLEAQINGARSTGGYSTGAQSTGRPSTGDQAGLGQSTGALTVGGLAAAARPARDWKLSDLLPVLDALRGLRFGSVEIFVQDSRLVQIDRREKIRAFKT